MRHSSPFALLAPLALLPLALLTAASPEAAAQDTRPVIQQVEMNGRPATRGPQGCVLILRGRNLHRCDEPPEGTDKRKFICPHKELEVKVDSVDAPILESTFDYVTIIVPQAVKPGRARIRLKIQGRGSAEANFEVIDQKAWQSDTDAAEQKAQETGGGRKVDVEEQILTSFQITRFQLVKGPAGNTFEVEAKTGKIPDRMRVQIALQYDGRTIMERTLPVDRGGVSTTFGPYAKQLLMGNYSVELLFELNKQSRVTAMRFVRDIGEKEREVYGRVLRREFTQVGTGPGGAVTDDDRKRQKDQLQAHVLQHVQAAEKLLKDVMDAYACAARCFYKRPGSSTYEEQMYKDYLQSKGFASTKEKLDAIVKDTRYATASGHFKAREYTEWAEKTLMPALEALYKKHVEFNEQTICPLDDRAQMLGDFLVSIILKLFQGWSEGLYTHSKLEAPQVVKMTAINPIASPTISPRFFDAKKKELLRQVGLDDFANAGSK